MGGRQTFQRKSGLQGAKVLLTEDRNRWGSGNGERGGASIRLMGSLLVGEKTAVSRCKRCCEGNRQTVPFPAGVNFIARLSDGAHSGLKIENLFARCNQRAVPGMKGAGSKRAFSGEERPHQSQKKTRF